MKSDITKFKKDVTLFFIVFIIAIVITNILYYNFAISNKVQYRQIKQFEQYSKNLDDNTIDFLILGDSQAQDSLNPMYLDYNSFNYASMGQQNKETYFRLKDIIDSGIQIKNVALEINLHRIRVNKNSQKQTANDIEILNQFNQIKDLTRNTIKEKFGFVGNGIDFGYMFLPQSNLRELYLGWMKFDHDKGLIVGENYSLASAENIEESYVSLMRDRFGTNAIQALDYDYILKTIELAHKNNISIILIRYPMTKESDDELKKYNISQNAYSELFEDISKITPEYTYLDYYDLFFGKNQYFGNLNHLNYQGAKIFSETVNEDLKKHITES